MKVRELIAALKKMPQDAEVVWQDHDNSEWEWNDRVRGVDDTTDEALSEEFGKPVVALHG